MTKTKIEKRVIIRNNWRAGYIERCKSGSEGGIQRPTLRTKQGVGCLPYFKDPQNPVYPTEKNHDMLTLIIAQSSLPESIVLDCFAGSGGTLVCAHELGRRFIGVDQSNEAIMIMRESLKWECRFIDCMTANKSVQPPPSL